MANMNSPLQMTQKIYETKEKLVGAVASAVADVSAQDAGELGARLAGASNRQLLRLAKVAGEIKSRYGSTTDLIGQLTEAMGKAKDADFRTRLGNLPLPRLLDMARSAERRVRARS